MAPAHRSSSMPFVTSPAPRPRDLGRHEDVRNRAQDEVVVRVVRVLQEGIDCGLSTLFSIVLMYWAAVSVPLTKARASLSPPMIDV